jgi:hypothetical protein
MDVEETRAMARQVEDAAGDVEQVAQELTAALEQVDWTGPDADRFRAMWHAELLPSLGQARDAIRDLDSRARADAAAQEATSSV